MRKSSKPHKIKKSRWAEVDPRDLPNHPANEKLSEADKQLLKEFNALWHDGAVLDDKWMAEEFDEFRSECWRRNNANIRDVFGGIHTDRRSSLDAPVTDDDEVSLYEELLDYEQDPFSSEDDLIDRIDAKRELERRRQWKPKKD